MLLEGKVVAVVGGAGHLGRALVKGILEKGGSCYICDTNLSAALSFQKALENQGFNGKVYSETIDIGSKTSIESVLGKIAKRFGTVHAVVNAAYPRNSDYGKKVEDVTKESFCENVGLNLGGSFLLSQVFCSYFLSVGGGNIINISSVYGLIAPRFEIYEGTAMTMPIEYSVIKSGVAHMSRYFAKYYKGKNIRVNCISPGGLLNNQPESFLESYGNFCLNKGVLEAADIVGTCTFLLSDESQYINGQNITVDDGFSL